MKIFTTLLLVFSISLGNLAVLAGDFQTVQLRGAEGTQRTSELSDVVFGPVESNDTLWSIARDYRNSDVFAQARPNSLYPVMYSIYVLNPAAFKDNNVNHLLDNAMLELPSVDFVAAVDVNLARNKIEGDEDKWGYEDRTAQTQTPASAVTSSASPDSGNANTVSNASSDNASSDNASVNTAPAIDSLVAQPPVGFNAQSPLNANELNILVELKNQYAISLETIQILLDENEQLSGQLQSVASQLEVLSRRVDGDVQEQLNAQAELQAQLYALLEEANLLTRTEPQSAWLSDVKHILKDPMVIIALVSGIVLLSLLAFGIWLFVRRAPSKPAHLADNAAGVAPVSSMEPDIATAPVTDTPDIIELSEMDLSDDSLFAEEPVNAESDIADLMLDEVAVDALADDDSIKPETKSTDIEIDESLTEALLDSDELLESDESSDSDEALEQQLRAEISEIEFEEATGELDQNTLDELFGAAGLSSGSIDSVADDELDENIDIDAILDAEISPVMEEPESASEIAANSEQNTEEQTEQNTEEQTEEVPEELADIADALSQSALPDNLDIDEYEALDEAGSAQLDQEITAQGQTIDASVDDLMNEIEQIEMMESMLDDAPSAADDNVQGDIDTLATEDEVAPLAGDELTDELLSQMSAEIDVKEALTDEVLNELLHDTDFSLVEELDTSSDPIETDAIGAEEHAALAEDPEAISQKAATLLDDLPDIGGWMNDDADADNGVVDDFEDTDFDELLHSLEIDSDASTSDTLDVSLADISAELAPTQSAELDSQSALASSIPAAELVDPSPDYIDVDVLLDDSNIEMTDEPEIDLLKHLEGMPEPVSDTDVLDDNAFASDLDLARAYIEMDEINEAKSLLNKVIVNGSDVQQHEAQSILAQIESL